MKDAAGHSTNGFEVIRFEDSSDLLVLNAKAVNACDARITSTYCLPALGCFDEKK